MALKQLFFLFLYISTAILPLTCNASIYRVPPPPAAAAALAPRGVGSNTKSGTTDNEEDRLVPFKIGLLTSFSILPRGMPFPPSGPSKRHNSIND